MMPQNTPEQLAFFNAVGSSNTELVRAMVGSNANLLNSFDYRSFGATPLTLVCFGHRAEMVQCLIELGVDPNRRSDWHMGPWSPLHCAVYRRDTALAEYLLAHGATLDVHTAAGLGRTDDVARLLDEDPSRVSEPGGDGCQPLHFADSIDVAQLLLDRGANINARCVDHYSTPVQYLCTARPEVARYLLTKGADPDVFSSITCGDLNSVQRQLDDDPSLLQARINQTFFPPGPEHDVHNILTFTVGQDASLLHAASRANQPQVIAELVGRGLPVDVRGGYDQATALHTAAWCNCVRAAEALLDQGADINIRSGRIHNNSPAGWAIVSGAEAVFRLLMERGAERYEWFLDDAKHACAGHFDQVSHAPREQRERILAWLQR